MLEMTELLMKTGHAHHNAYLETDGVDPEWPLWYSKQLKESLPTLLGTKLTRSRIIYELIRLEDTADISEEHWTKVYAEQLLKKYG